MASICGRLRGTRAAWPSVLGLLAVVGNAGCGGDDAAPVKPAHHKDAGAQKTDAGGLQVLIGTPDPDTGIDFVELQPGGDIPLETFGQGGTHASLAIRCIGFGNQAFVDVAVENPAEGTRVTTVPSIRAQLLACDPDDPRICDDVPVHVMTGGLADPDKKDGLSVRVVAVVHTTSGQTATGMQDGVLRKNF